MFLGGVRFLTTLGVGVWFFCPTPSADAQLDHFYITLLNWEFWLKWYNFFWKFCWIRGFLLCTTISIDFNSQISFSLCQGLGVGNFGKVGVLYFTSDSATLLETRDAFYEQQVWRFTWMKPLRNVRALSCFVHPYNKTSIWWTCSFVTFPQLLKRIRNDKFGIHLKKHATAITVEFA